MIIAADYNAALRQVAGIGRYSREMVRALLAADPSIELRLFYAARDLKGDSWGLKVLHELQRSFRGVHPVGLPFSERQLAIIWQRARLPLPVELWTGPVGIVHALDFVLPPVRRARSVVTVHDLSFRVHPEAAHPKLKRYLDRAVPWALERSSHVVAVSRSTAVDVHRLLHVPMHKITVIEHGISPRFRRIEDHGELERVRSRYALRRPFFLHVGTIEPRKNLLRLMEAFAGMQQGAEARPELVLAGKQGWLSDPIVAGAQATSGVRLLGAVDEADLPALYSLAQAVVYPSLYEGFGFPALEALACGTPVITSNTSSLPEVVGSAAIMVDPRDVTQLRQAMERVLVEPQTVVRVAGPRQTARFTWERAAQQLLEVYRRLLQPS